MTRILILAMLAIMVFSTTARADWLLTARLSWDAGHHMHALGESPTKDECEARGLKGMASGEFTEYYCEPPIEATPGHSSARPDYTSAPKHSAAGYPLERNTLTPGRPGSPG